MVWFLFVVALLGVMFGTVMVFATQLATQNLCNKIRTRDPRMVGGVEIVLGVFLLISSPTSSQVSFIVILGLLACIKGLLFLFGPKEKVNAFIAWWFNTTENTRRIWGAVLTVVSIVVLATLVRY